MKRVSTKHNMWHYQVYIIKFQFLDQAHLQTKHHRRNKIGEGSSSLCPLTDFVTCVSLSLVMRLI